MVQPLAPAGLTVMAEVELVGELWLNSSPLETVVLPKVKLPEKEEMPLEQKFPSGKFN